VDRAGFMYLYRIAVFARHFGNPLQYFANTGALLLDLSELDSVACKYTAMLFFMNLSVLDSSAPFYFGRPSYEFLKGDQ